MTAVSAAGVPAKKKRGVPGFAQLQRIGRSLMLPIASLPAAGLLLRLGQGDMLGGTDGGLASHSGFTWLQPVADVLATAGDAILSNLPIIFAIGVAIGFARKSDGSTALAALIGYLVFSNVTKVLAADFGGLPKTMSESSATQQLTDIYDKAGGAGAALTPGMTLPGGQVVADGTTLPATVGDFIHATLDPLRTINYGVLGGIIIGVLAAVLYQKYYRIKLPTYLGFFGGRRFVPIITAGASVIVGVLLALIYPVFDAGFSALGNWVVGAPIIGGFVYGVANRLLIPFGLHHLLNNFPWFQFGTYTDPSGAAWTGDIARFLHGDPTAGSFMTGFFPIMMFALPAVALAFWHTAKPEKRKITGGIMISVAFTAFLTGITEPIEFAFVYIAYPLYLIHSVLTGAALAICNALDLHMGFSFSAGAIDFLLNFGKSMKAGDPASGIMGPLLIIGIGLIFAVIYYFLFRFVITKFDLKTPGREDDGEVASSASVLVDQGPADVKTAEAKPLTT